MSAPLPIEGGAVTAYKKEFWSKEGPKFAEPHYRLQRCARLVNAIAAGHPRSLLDVGCGPATLRRCLDANIDYHGIDIAVPYRCSYLTEADIVENPIDFGGKRFDIVVAQGVFEYLGDVELEKFREIASLLNTDGKFVATYTNFGHRQPRYYEAFSNVRSVGSFRDDLGVVFEIERAFPASHNWSHGQPVRPITKALNRRVSTNIPLVSKSLAVEYFFVCTPRR